MPVLTSAIKETAENLPQALRPTFPQAEEQVVKEAVAEEPIKKADFKTFSINQSPNSTYKNNVYIGEQEYRSDKFPDVPNYLMHTTTYSDNLANKKTRVLQSIDSDALNEGVPKSAYQDSWLRKGMSRELDEAIAEGQEQVAIPLSGPGVELLDRTPAQQAWYETKVKGEAEKLARARNLKYSVTKAEDGTEYAIVSAVESGVGEKLVNDVAKALKSKDPYQELTKLGYSGKQVMAAMEQEGKVFSDWTPAELATRLQQESGVIRDRAAGFSLYSSPAIGAFATYEAMKAGYSEEQIQAKLAEAGYEESEVSTLMEDGRRALAAASVGYSDDEIKDYLKRQEPTIGDVSSRPANEVVFPDEDTRIGKIYREITGTEELSPTELVAKLEVVAPKSNFFTMYGLAYLGDQNAQRAISEVVNASNSRIIQLAKQRGLDLFLQDGEFYANTPSGPAKVDPEWWRSFWEAKGEAVFGTGGAVAGAVAGARIGARFPNIHPWAKSAVTLTTSTLGAAIGSVAGTELDYLHNAIVLQEDLNAEVAARKALTSAEASVVLDAAAAGILKIGGKGWNGIVRAKNFIKNNTYDKARAALREQLFVDDATAKELVEKLASVADVPGKRTSTKEIAATALTRPGVEGLVQATSQIDPKASLAVSKAINDRAQDLLKATAEAKGDQVGKVLQNELEAFTSAVKENYSRVRNYPVNTPRYNDFSFDADALVIQPVLDRVGKSIDDPAVAFKFGNKMDRILELTNSRKFSDLIELRQIVNDFRYNTPIKKSPDFKMLEEVVARIDKTIERGAKEIMPNESDQWLKQWTDAKNKYRDMKRIERNELAKIITKPGVSDDTIGKALVKYSGSLDSTFSEVMAQLPKGSRTKVEGSILNSLAEKYTAGVEGGMRAVHFPMLANELEKITFTTNNGRAMKKAIVQLGEAFKNDVPLAQASGNIQIPKFQSYLTTSPVARLRFEVASGIFNTVKRLFPTDQSKMLSLVKKTADLLENPVNSKRIDELMKELEGEVELQKQVEQYVAAAVQEKATNGFVGAARVRMYGDGKILHSKGSGKEHSIPIHRIAPLDTARQLAENKGVNPADKKAMDRILKEQGYMAVQMGSESIRVIE